MGKQWEKIFKKYGKFFIKPQADMPKVIKLFKEHNAKRVLDLGCGTGRHLVYLAKHGFEVYGIDIAPEGIRIAKDWLRKEKLKANLKIGSVYKKLPYKDNFFNAIISTQVIHHARIETIRKAIKEMERILKPKGLIFVTVRKRGSKKEIPKERLWKIKFIAPRTFVPLSHEEKGLIHYLFNKKLLRKEFKNFKIRDIWLESHKTHYHYCLLGELKIKK